ncbi:MAG: lysylphosphatidylglycerol synthase transmembrane domain-containing protein [Acidobacteriota bacterium]|jgi:glycosyltransferase 2 family protein
MSKKQIIFWIGSILLSILLLYLFLRDAHLADVWRELKNVSIPLVALAVCGEIVSILFRSYRWGILLKPVQKHVRFSSLLKATNLSFTLSGLFPGRIGEVARPFLLSRWENMPFGPVLASVMLERGMDLFAIVALWFVFVFFGSSGLPVKAHETMRIVSDASWPLLVLCVAAMVFMWWLAPRRKVLQRWSRRSEKLRRYPLVKKVLNFFFRFAEGLGSFRKKRMILFITFLSLMVWLPVAFTAGVVLSALKLPLPWGASLLLLTFVSLGAVIPTPGGVGGVHKAIQMALIIFYFVSEDAAVSAGILCHAAMFFPGILWGLGYLVAGRVSLSELRQATRESGHLNNQER